MGEESVVNIGGCDLRGAGVYTSEMHPGLTAALGWRCVTANGSLMAQ